MSYHLRCRWVALFRCRRCLEKCLHTLWWTLRLSIYFSMSCFFWWFYMFWIFIMTNASSFHSTHIYQLLFYLQGFSYYVCAYNVISFKFKIQTKTLSLALIRRYFLFFCNWDSLHARLNSHYVTWSYKKKGTKKITG